MEYTGRGLGQDHRGEAVSKKAVFKGRSEEV